MPTLKAQSKLNLNKQSMGCALVDLKEMDTLASQLAVVQHKLDETDDKLNKSKPTHKQYLTSLAAIAKAYYSQPVTSRSEIPHITEMLGQQLELYFKRSRKLLIPTEHIPVCFYFKVLRGKRESIKQMEARGIVIGERTRVAMFNRKTSKLCKILILDKGFDLFKTFPNHTAVVDYYDVLFTPCHDVVGIPAACVKKYKLCNSWYTKEELKKLLKMTDKNFCKYLSKLKIKYMI